MLSRFQSPQTPMSVQWYHETDRSANELLITVGDSWTWGDSLGQASARDGRDDAEHRLEHIYGTQASRSLGMDHINIGLPGLSNIDMLQHFERVLAGMVKSYQNIYVVFTLTELGREFNGGFLHQEQAWEALRGEDWPRWQHIIDATEDAASLQFAQQDMLDNHIDLRYHLDLYLLARTATSVPDLLERVEAYVESSIRKAMQHQTTHCYIGRAFTKAITRTPDPKRLGSWVDVIADRGSLPPYPDQVWIMSQAGLRPTLEICDHLEIPQRKQQWMPVLQRAEQAIHWLDQSPYNNRAATRHPKETAHLWWAEHIKEKIYA